MKREILFRGKDRNGILNHSWLYGSLDNSNEDFPEIIYKDKWGNTIYADVLIKSVGQFTGLTDKNGKKIFEGDIVKSQQGKIFTICFKEGAFCWDDNKGYWYALDDSEFGYAYKGICDELEVIGNIHDNRNLIEVEQ